MESTTRLRWSRLISAATWLAKLPTSILLRSEIDAVPESLGLARAALRTIKREPVLGVHLQPVWCAAAVLGFISPVLCGGDRIVRRDGHRQRSAAATLHNENLPEVPGHGSRGERWIGGGSSSNRGSR